MRSAIAITARPGSVIASQALAAALENDDPEFVLEQLDLLGNPRLRGMQRFRRLGNVEATARDFDEIAELLELHGGCTVRLVIRI
jgi:hypothetical protein